MLFQEGGEGDKSEKVEVFSGSQPPVQTRAGSNQITVALKDVGAGRRSLRERLADGRSPAGGVRFSDGVLSPGEGRPELHVFQSESTLSSRG